MDAAKKPALARKISPKLDARRRRPGAGRKPRPITELNRAIAERSDDALYALDIHVRTMRDIDADLKLRLECAREVMNRILGKPTEKHEHTSDPDAPILIQYVNDWRSPSPAASDD